MGDVSTSPGRTGHSGEGTGGASPSPSPWEAQPCDDAGPGRRPPTGDDGFPLPFGALSARVTSVSLGDRKCAIQHPG